ncbi:MAG: MFS transporter [Burkholderiaceae bacterium]|nr:MFS transporter [Burkholderiaceae bacterium]
MYSPYLTVAAVIAGAMLLQAASGLLLVLLPLRMTAEGFSVQSMGWVAAAHGAGFLAGCVITSRMVSAIGHVRAFAALAAALSAIALSFATFDSPLAWFALRLAGGVSFAGLYAVAESWIAECTPRTLRGRVLGFYTVCTRVALVIAPLSLGWFALEGPWAFMLISALCSLALLPVTTTRSASPATTVQRALNIGRLYRLTPVGLLGCFSVGLINAPLLSLVPVYGGVIGLDVDTIVVLFPVLQLGSLVLQWPLGRWSDRVDRRRIICGQCVAVAVLSLPLALLDTPQLWLLLPLLFLLGGAALSIYAICVAHAGDHASSDQMVSLLSGLLLAWGVGAAIGPAAAAAVMDRVGAGGLFMYISVVALAFALYVVHRMWARLPAPIDEHVRFVDVPPTSAAAAELSVNERAAGSRVRE